MFKNQFNCTGVEILAHTYALKTSLYFENFRIS